MPVSLHKSAVVQMCIGAFVLMCICANVRAEEPGASVVTARLSLSVMALGESQAQDASQNTLAFGELRGVVDGRSLAGGLEFRGDFRLRLSNDFSTADALTGVAQTTARGWLGGREYDLRELWVGRHGESVDFALGRLIVREADALIIDGARAWWRVTPAWHASLFGGLYPNPYARSLPDDYIASDTLAFAAGADAAYHLPSLWGSASLVGAVFGGNHDGAPISPASPLGKPATEASRVYVTWTNAWRATAWLDLFHDLVVDLAGSAGAQLTRADLDASLHWRRLEGDAGWDHLSSLAIDMYLVNLLTDRARSSLLPGTIESNLVVERTARDEGHLRVAVRPIGGLRVWGEARLRQRALVDGAADPSYTSQSPRGAWDLSLGARLPPERALADLRAAVALAYIADYRAYTTLVTFDLGRDFWDERLSLDAQLEWERIHDGGAGASMTAIAMCAQTPLAPSCYGTAAGDVLQVGLTLALRPAPRWFALVDYRLVADSLASARITTQIIYARIEVRM